MARAGTDLGGRASNALAALLLLLSAGCTHASDVEGEIEASVRRMLELGSPTWAVALGALKPEQFEVVRRHPRTEVQTCAAQWLRSESPERRALASYLLIALWDGATSDGEREGLTAQLATLLADVAPSVCALAADAVVGIRLRDLRMPLPGAALAVVREGLQVADEDEQLAAMSTAMLLGRDVGPLRRTLLELLRSPSPGVRRFAAVALTRVRPLDPELQQLRQQWLESVASDADLPALALGWFEQAPAGGGAAIPRILQLARDPASHEELRSGALRALARLATTPADADATLALLLARHAALSPKQRVAWSRQFAQLAVHLSDSPMLAQATALLQAQRVADPEDVATAAALVRIAAVERRTLPAPELVATIRDEVQLLSSLHRDGSLPGEPSEGDQAAVEGFVALAAWPGSGVAAEIVRPLLADQANNPQRQCQDWAQELLERLPK